MSTYFLRGHLSPTLGALPRSEPDAYSLSDIASKELL